MSVTPASKDELVLKYFPKKKGSKILLPVDEGELEHTLRVAYPEHKFTVASEFNLTRGLGKANYDAAVIQYTGIVPKGAMAHLGSILMFVKPGGVIAIDGVIKSPRFMRVPNRAISAAVAATLEIQTLKEIVQLDIESGDGIFIGRTSK